MHVAPRIWVKPLYQIGIAVGGIFFLVSGYFEITKNPATYPKTLSMGYPPYFITTLGIAKIVGAIALWLPDFKGMKEWIFAGFTFDIIFAFISGLQINSMEDCLKAAIAFTAVIIVFVLYRMQSRSNVPDIAVVS